MRQEDLGILVESEGIINAKQYINILKNYLKNIRCKKEKDQFQQNNSFKKATKWSKTIGL